MSGSITPDRILEQLRTVQDPELHKDLVSLDMVKDIAIEGSTVRLGIELTTPACPLKDKIRGDIERAVRRIGGVEAVEIEWSAQVRSSRQAVIVLPEVKNILAVGAGKGGVGKSTAAVLLAYGLARSGTSVGLMDADVYGPSIPTMTGIEGLKPRVVGGMIQPICVSPRGPKPAARGAAGGLKVISIGLLIDRDKPVIWRGPMVHGAVRQFLEQVEWGALDYLIVDLPPGTGDVPLTLAQSIPMTGSVVICTPQDVALQDARRAVKMYEQLNVGCLGIIENMSYYLCPHCGHRDELFDHGGAETAARELGVPFLGEIPLNAKLRLHADAGRPDRNFTDTDEYVIEAINRVVANVAGQISVKSRLQLAPTLSVE